MSEPLRVPNLEAQRAAMAKLSFLVGRWSGRGRIHHGAHESVLLDHTEEANYRLDGLLLVVEALGRSQVDGKKVLQAFGVISYDDEAAVYRMRAFNDGRFVESDVEVLTEGHGLRWGFSLGEIRTRSILRIDEKGEWTERHEISSGAEPFREFMELSVRRHE